MESSECVASSTIMIRILWSKLGLVKLNFMVLICLERRNIWLLMMILGVKYTLDEASTMQEVNTMSVPSGTCAAPGLNYIYHG